MSGAMRKMGVYLGLLEDVDGEYAEADYNEPTTETRVHQAAANPARPAARPVANLDERRRPAAPAPVAAAPAPSDAGTQLSRITTLHPRTYNEARVIGENYRDGIPVIMNLSEMSDADAKRLVDFAAGLIFSVRGSIERVTNKVFLLTPPNVTVDAEAKQRIADGGFFNQS